MDKFLPDGVVAGSSSNPSFKQYSEQYKEIGEHIFLLYDPEQSSMNNNNKKKDSKDFKEEPNKTEFDIVLVHGLGSDEFRSWTDDNGLLWPAVFLPQDFPTARVMTAGYTHSLWTWSSANGSDTKNNNNDDGNRSVAAASQNVSSSSSSPSIFRSSALLGSNKAKRNDEEEKNGSEESEGKQKKALKKEGVDDNSNSGSKNKDTQSSNSKNGSSPFGEALSSLYEQLPPILPQMLFGESTTTTTTTTTTTDTANSSAPKRVFPGGEKVDFKEAGGVEGASQSATHASAAATAASSSASVGGGRTVAQVNTELCAADLKRRLMSAGVGVGKRPVVFIVHSMGGLVVKQMIVSLAFTVASTPENNNMDAGAAWLTASENDKKSAAAAVAGVGSRDTSVIVRERELLHAIRGVVFYATPHFGSAVASVVSGLRPYYQTLLGGLSLTDVVVGLGDHNRKELSNLNDEFFSFVRAQHGRCGVLSFGETKRLNGIVLVVEPSSSNPAPDNPLYPFYLIDEDHSSINTPSSKLAPNYSILLGFLDRLQQRDLLRPYTEVRASPASSAATVVATRQLEPTSSNTTSAKQDGDHQTTASSTTPVDWDSFFERDTMRTSLEPTRLARVSSAASVSTSSPEDPGQSGRMLSVSETPSHIFKLTADVYAAVAALQSETATLFGRLMPVELDALLLLARDVVETVQEEIMCETSVATRGDGSDRSSGGGRVQHAAATLSDVLILPLQLLKRVVESGRNTIHGLQAMRAEKAAPQRHLSTLELRELDTLDKQVSVLRSEWETYRLQLRLARRSGPRSNSEDSQGGSSGALNPDAVALYFRQSIKSAVTSTFNDDGSMFSFAYDLTLTTGLELRAGAPFLRGWFLLTVVHDRSGARRHFQRVIDEVERHNAGKRWWERDSKPAEQEGADAKANRVPLPLSWLGIGASSRDEDGKSTQTEKEKKENDSPKFDPLDMGTIWDDHGNSVALTTEQQLCCLSMSLISHACLTFSHIMDECDGPATLVSHNHPALRALEDLADEPSGGTSPEEDKVAQPASTPRAQVVVPLLTQVPAIEVSLRQGQRRLEQLQRFLEKAEDDTSARSFFRQTVAPSSSSSSSSSPPPPPPPSYFQGGNAIPEKRSDALSSSSTKLPKSVAGAGMLSNGKRRRGQEWFGMLDEMLRNIREGRDTTKGEEFAANAIMFWLYAEQRVHLLLVQSEYLWWTEEGAMQQQQQQEGGWNSREPSSSGEGIEFVSPRLYPHSFLPQYPGLTRAVRRKMNIYAEASSHLRSDFLACLHWRRELEQRLQEGTVGQTLRRSFQGSGPDGGANERMTAVPSGAHGNVATAIPRVSPVITGGGGGARSNGSEQDSPLTLLWESLQLDPHNPSSKLLYGQYLLDCGKMSDAAAAFHDVLERTRSPVGNHYYLTAAVGLAWSHLRRVTREHEPVHDKEGHRIAVPLLFDPLTELHTPNLLRNMELTVLQRSAEVASSSSSTSSNNSPASLVGLGRERKGGPLQSAYNTETASAATSAAFSSSERGWWDEYASQNAFFLTRASALFSEVLLHDPQNPLALCGMGRLRTLSAPGCNDMLDFAAAQRFFFASLRATFGEHSLSPLLGPQQISSNNATSRGLTILSRGVSSSSMGYNRRCIGTQPASVAAAWAAYWLGELCTAVALPVPDASNASSSLQNHHHSKKTKTATTNVSSEAKRQALSPQTLPSSFFKEGDFSDARVHAAAQWYDCCLRLDPTHAWARTSLGLLHLRKNNNTNNTNNNKTKKEETMEGNNVGWNLLQSSLRLQPTNTWTLWGAGTYAPDASLARACREQLRRQLVNRVRWRIR